MGVYWGNIGIVENKVEATIMGLYWVAVKIMITGNWPLMPLRMQVSTTLQSAGKSLHLAWRPRDINTEADGGTNAKYDAFDAGHLLQLPFRGHSNGVVQGSLTNP